MNLTIKKTHLWLAVAVVVVAALNVWLLIFAKNKIDFKQLLVTKPKLNLMVIREPSCADCFDLTQVSDVITKTGVRVSLTTLNRQDPKAADLIKQYDIKFLPSFVATGDISAPALKPLWDNFGTITGNAVIFAKQVPKYYEIATGKIFGDFEIIYLTDKACASCYDVTTHAIALKNLGMETSKTTTLEMKSPEAQVLIKKYKITSLPTVLLRGDLAQYEVFDSVWKDVGTKETDGTYVFRDPGQKQMGTYIDLKTGKVIPQQVLNDDGTLPQK